MIDITIDFIALKQIQVKRLYMSNSEGDLKMIPQHYFYTFGSNLLVFETKSGDDPEEIP